MDVALKQRLVGATVLIALAVIVVPMFLGGRSEQGSPDSRKIELPPQPAELDFQTRRYPIGEEAPGAGAATTGTEPAPGAVAHVELQSRDFEDALQQDAARPQTDSETEPAVEDSVAAAAQEPVAEPPPPAIEPEPESAPPAPPKPAVQGAADGRYVVQVASFGSVDNANRLAGILQAQGFAVLSDTVKSDVGTLHRVRIGPFASETEANRAVSQVRQSVEGVKPRVVDLQPEVAAQVTSPSDPLVRWVVQVGSFSSSDNADKLVERLRGDGLSAYKEAVSSSGSTIYRVRVGPYVEREEAIRVDARVRERFSLDGVVMSAD